MADQDVNNSCKSPKKKESRLRHRDRLPPGWEWWRYLLVGLSEALVWIPGLLIVAVCLNLLFGNFLALTCECWIYVPGFLFLIGLCAVRYLRHSIGVHEARLVDRTEVEALFQWAESALDTNEEAPPARRDALRQLIDCLREAGPSTWTEYRVLPVEQGALECLHADDLIARARARLEDLKEYDEKTTDADKSYFRDRGNRLRESIEKLDGGKSGPDREGAIHALRADLSMLLETIADYDKNWAIGSEILSALLIVISFAIPIFLLMGVTPALLEPEEGLGLGNWALLGVAGALTAVLRKLYLENKVEVGVSEGKNELSQSMKGAILGLVSGILVFLMLRGGLFKPGAVLPDVKSACLDQIYLSVFWAFLAGFAFESVFERVQKEKVGESN